MTAPIEWPSLDKILTDATPVETPPFDLGALVLHDACCLSIGVGDDKCDCPARHTRNDIARYVNGLRCDIESARSAAVAFENRIAEALERLDKAVPYLTDADQDVAGFIDEAVAALRGEQP